MSSFSSLEGHLVQSQQNRDHLHEIRACIILHFQQTDFHRLLTQAWQIIL